MDGHQHRVKLQKHTIVEELKHHVAKLKFAPFLKIFDDVSVSSLVLVL